MKLAELDLMATWKALGGGSLKGRRGTAFWRNGDGWSVSLDLKQGAWYDHRDGRGGGVLDLVMTALQCDRRAALAWLEQNCGLEPRHSLSAGQRRDWRRRRVQAEGVAQRVLWWRASLLSNLEQSKSEAYRRYMAEPGQETERSWADACRHLYDTQQLHGAELLGAYRDAAQQDPAGVERLVAAACEDEAHAELYAGFVVARLGVIALREK